jgi:hypothetical protein
LASSISSQKDELGHRQTIAKEVDNAFVLAAIRNPLLI